MRALFMQGQASLIKLADDGRLGDGGSGVGDDDETDALVVVPRRRGVADTVDLQMNVRPVGDDLLPRSNNVPAHNLRPGRLLVVATHGCHASAHPLATVGINQSTNYVYIEKCMAADSIYIHRDDR